jgi:hypothetical protein
MNHRMGNLVKSPHRSFCESVRIVPKEEEKGLDMNVISMYIGIQLQ